MVLTVSFVLSPVIGLVTRRQRKFISADLTPAPRRQDHTTSPSAAGAVRHQRRPRIPPHVDDVRNAPLLGQDGGSRRSDLPDGESEIFFREGLDTICADLPVGQITL
jgi:hypothetical protein